MMNDQPAAVLREGRTTLPRQQWLWVPGVGIVAFVLSMVVWGTVPAALTVAAGLALLVLAVLLIMTSWRWKITSTHIEVGRLGWPLLRGGRSLHLSRVGKVDVTTGGREQVWDSVSFGRSEGRVFPWMHGAVVVEQGLGIGVAGPDAISPVQVAGQRVVIGTATSEEARETAAGPLRRRRLPDPRPPPRQRPRRPLRLL